MSVSPASPREAASRTTPSRACWPCHGVSDSKVAAAPGAREQRRASKPSNSRPASFSIQGLAQALFFSACASRHFSVPGLLSAPCCCWASPPLPASRRTSAGQLGPRSGLGRAGRACWSRGRGCAWRRQRRTKTRPAARRGVAAAASGATTPPAGPRATVSRDSLT